MNEQLPTLSQWDAMHPADKTRTFFVCNKLSLGAQCAWWNDRAKAMFMFRSSLKHS